MKLIAYVRTSNGKGSVDSLDAQADACREWAEASGHEVASVQQDEGKSGGLGIEDRPGLAAALLALEEGEADGLIVHRLDRLARELHIQEAALARAWQVGDHVKVIEAVEGEVLRDDPEDPQRRFLRQVMGAAAELERGLIRARLHRGRRRKAARGGWVGGHRLHPKYGYRLVTGPDGKPEYEDDPEQQGVIQRARDLKADGLSYRAIADQLAAEEITPPSGPTWHAMTVHRLLGRDSASG